MKVRVFLPVTLLFLLLQFPPVRAQIGLKAGPGISDVAFLKDGQTPYLGYEINALVHRVPLVTFQAGAFGIFGITKRIEFRPELLFVTQGLNYNTEFLYDDITYKINSSYLHVPLLLKYKTTLKKKWKPGLIAGPYISRKLKAVRTTEVDGRREKTSLSNVKSTDFGIVAGFAADFELPFGHWVVDLRTSYSLVNMMDRVEGYIPWYYGPTKEYARNISISLTVGYQFINLWKGKADRQ